MMPLVSTPLSTAGMDAAGAIDRVDRAHVMPMAARHRRARFEIHAERGAEEGEFRVVRCESVAGQEHVHVATPDELAEIRRRRRCE